MQGGGIEISDRSVKYMQFRRRGRRSARLVSFGEIPLPHGIVEDGEILDKEALVGVLRLARSRCRFYLCYASLPESKGYLFSDQLPRQGTADIKSALALALSEHVPLAPAEAVYDCEIVETESTSDTVSIIAAATTEALASAYASALSGAGFLPLSFELEPQAAARAILPGSDGSAPQATIIADLGETKTMLCVVEGGIARFTTSSDGSSAIDATIATAGADAREIIRRKIDLGIVHGNHADIKSFMALADRFTDEISRLVAYWNAHGASLGGRASIGSIVLYGGNANIKGLPEYLSHKIGLPARIAHIWEELGGERRIYPIAADQTMRFATVAGLALCALQHGPLE